MARMHALWCVRHPEHDAFTPQNLRDYVSHLRSRGYVRTAPQPVIEVAELPPNEPVEDVFLVVPPTPEGFSTRRGLHNIKTPGPQDLARVDAELREALPEVADIWHINCAVYAAAQRFSQVERRNTASPQEKAGQRIRKMEAKIQSARQHASRIQCVMDYMAANRPFTPKVRRIAANLRRVHHTLNRAVLQTTKQHCLDRIRMLVICKKSLVRRARGMAENKLFRQKPSRLFEPPQRVVENPPTVELVENFWKTLYEQKLPLNRDTPALAHFEAFCQRLQQPHEVCQPITPEEVRRALEGSKNFAAPGPDGINNFWWKKLTCTHHHLARIFNAWLNGEQQIPSWVVEGRTVLIPKSGDLSNPKNYRPITCLNACYKVFTRILYMRVLQAVERVYERIYEQRGSKRGVAGCKENLLIDRCVTQDSVQYKRNLSMAWIDYRKAFDMTSHELIVHLLRCLAVPDPVVRCIEELMPLWRTRFTITSGNDRVQTEPVSFKRGVFQGDSLSPLLFCISLLPLSVSLRKTRGYNCGTPGNRRHKVTHLFYMDDLKLYASGERDLHQSLGVVQEYTQAVGMEFGLDKCALVHLKRGRCGDYGEDAQLVDGSILHHLNAGESYTYLGVEQRSTQEVSVVKNALRGKYQHRLRQIWSSELSGKNKVSATNMLAVPILLYSFGVVKWTREELRQLDVGTRKKMHLNRSLHPKSSVPRLYLPRHQGGRGLLSLESLHNRLVLDGACNIIRSSDPLLCMVRDHENAGVGAFLFKAARRAADELGLIFDAERVNRNSVTELEPARRKAQIKAAEHNIFLQLHTDKPMHGVFYKNIEDLGLSKRLTFAFLRSAGLKSETEGFIMACQDGVFNTLVYRRRVMGMEVPDVSCRACRRAPETVMHLLSACPTYAVSAYIQRHNAALRVLYYHLRHSYEIDETPVLPYAPGDIESVVGNEKCLIYWNYSFPTVRQIQANKPDIVLLDRQLKTMYVIEFSAPAENNIVMKEEEKRTKYRDLLFELRRLYPDHTVKIVVLIIGALGGIRHTLLSELKIIPACRNSAEILAGRMQKAIILGSLRLLRAHDSRTQ